MTCATVRKYVRGRSDLQSIKRFWGGLKGKILIVIPGLPVKEITNRVEGERKEDVLLGKVWLNFGGDYQGLEFVRRILFLLYGEYNEQVMIVRPDEVADWSLEDYNLVLLGGPEGNEISKKLVREEKLNLKDEGTMKLIREGNLTIPDKRNEIDYNLWFDGKKFESGFDKHQNYADYVYDYGLLRRQKWGNNKVLFLFAGSRTYGTQAAAAIATLGQAIEDMLNKGLQLDDLSVICRIECDTLNQTLPELKYGDHTKVQIVRPFESQKWDNPRDVTLCASGVQLAAYVGQTGWEWIVEALGGTIRWKKILIYPFVLGIISILAGTMILKSSWIVTCVFLLTVLGVFLVLFIFLKGVETKENIIVKIGYFTAGFLLIFELMALFDLITKALGGN